MLQQNGVSAHIEGDVWVAPIAPMARPERAERTDRERARDVTWAPAPRVREPRDAHLLLTDSEEEEEEEEVGQGVEDRMPAPPAAPSRAPAPLLLIRQQPSAENVEEPSRPPGVFIRTSGPFPALFAHTVSNASTVLRASHRPQEAPSVTAAPLPTASSSGGGRGGGGFECCGARRKPPLGGEAKSPETSSSSTASRSQTWLGPTAAIGGGMGGGLLVMGVQMFLSLQSLALAPRPESKASPVEKEVTHWVDPTLARGGVVIVAGAQ